MLMIKVDDLKQLYELDDAQWLEAEVLNVEKSPIKSGIIDSVKS
jgi:hypothetical protein